MKKKLGLMCALLHEPALVVLDEPTNGLDPHGTMVLHELMREIAKAGRTVLFSTHLLDQAERLCSRVAVVSHGQLAAEGTLVELQNRFGASESLESLFFRLTESAADQAPRHMLPLRKEFRHEPTNNTFDIQIIRPHCAAAADQSQHVDEVSELEKRR